MERIITTKRDGEIRVRDYDVNIAIASGENMKVLHEGRSMTLTVDQLKNSIISRSPTIPSMYGGPAYCLLGYAWQPDVEEVKVEVKQEKQEEMSEKLYKIKVTEERVVIEEKELDVTLAGYMGTKLNQIRQSKGLEQSELSKLTGVSQATISRIENNTGSDFFPKIQNLQALAKALNVDVMELFPKE